MNKNEPQIPKRAIFIPPEIEYQYLVDIQQGNKKALRDLATIYSWFVLTVAHAYSEKKNEEQYTKRLEAVSGHFADVAKSICLLTDNHDFLTEVLVRVDETLGKARRKKKVAKINETLQLYRLAFVESLSRPISHDNDTQIEEFVADDKPNIEEQIGFNTESKFWKSVKKVLSDEEQLVLKVLYEEDFTLAQVADELGITQSKAKTMLSRAQRKLKHELQKIYGSKERIYEEV